MKEKILKTVVFISNYFNHHQKAFSQAMFQTIGNGYVFIETEIITEERKSMGWGEKYYPNYVVSKEEFAKDNERYMSIINTADVVIVGSAPRSLVKQRIKENKIVFYYSERPLKSESPKWKYLFRFLNWRRLNPQRKYVNMLCASAYTAADYAKFGLYNHKCYKWGYFPEVKKYEDIDVLIAEKAPMSILWVARFIEWKHPEVLIELAKCLKSDGYDFNIKLIGNGVLEQTIKSKISSLGLDDQVHMLGTMKPEQVREHMEKSELFVFTSDRNEGWGAVLNESMNSACAVVASHAIGSVPFLIEDGQNGLIYRDGDIDDLCNKIKWLIDHQEERKQIAKKAYLAMTDEWNAENAASKFINLSEKMLNGIEKPNIYACGICSKAEVLKDNWYDKDR